MNKEDLIKFVADQHRMTQRESHALIGGVLQLIGNALAKGDKVTLVGFGTFQVRERAAREGRNPRTGAVIRIPAKKTPCFVPGKALRERVALAGKKLAGARR
ncbi:MAG: HU family DNA-binding protein [Candidatus Sericytochromatia bacterium]|nr:HU family DNA-binding protein [Candidatus Sericytochromatia bacterium]